MAKYCVNCGKELDEDSLFCWSCGQAVDKEKTDIVDDEKKHLVEEKGLKEDSKVVREEVLYKDKFHLEGKHKKILIGIAGCSFVIILTFVLLLNMGAFLSDADKVLMALENTMMESRLVQDLSCARVILEDKYTVEMDGRVGEERIKTVHIRDGAERYISMEYKDVDYKMHLKKDELMFWDYRLEDKVLMYQYRQEQGEELRDAVGEENIDAFNILLKKLYDENIDKSIIFATFVQNKPDYVLFFCYDRIVGQLRASQSAHGALHHRLGTDRSGAVAWIGNADSLPRFWIHSLHCDCTGDDALASAQGASAGTTAIQRTATPPKPSLLLVLRLPDPSKHTGRRGEGTQNGGNTRKTHRQRRG